MILVGGFAVAPAEVERVIERLPGVREPPSAAQDGEPVKARYRRWRALMAEATGV